MLTSAGFKMDIKAAAVTNNYALIEFNPQCFSRHASFSNVCSTPGVNHVKSYDHCHVLSYSIILNAIQPRPGDRAVM
jgi:hypothetical protein